MQRAVLRCPAVCLHKFTPTCNAHSHARRSAGRPNFSRVSFLLSPGTQSAVRYYNGGVPWPVAVCNRTLYGDVGKTYELELQKPLENRLPFLCHLTFTANGHIHGDLVQVGKRSTSLSHDNPFGYASFLPTQNFRSLRKIGFYSQQRSGTL